MAKIAIEKGYTEVADPLEGYTEIVEPGPTVTDPNRFDPNAQEQHALSLLDMSEKFEVPIDPIEKYFKRYEEDDIAANMSVWREVQDLQNTWPLSGQSIAKESAKGIVRFAETGLMGTIQGTFTEWIGDFIEWGGGVIEEAAKIGSKNPDMLHNIHAQSIMATGRNISKVGREARDYWATQAATGWEALDKNLRKTDPVAYAAGRVSEGVTSSALAVVAAYLSGGVTAGPELANKGFQINRALLLLSSLSAAGGYQHSKEQGENFLWSTTHGLADGMIEYVMESTFLEGVGNNMKWAGPKEGLEELVTGMLQNTRAGILENMTNGMSTYDASKTAMVAALKQSPWEVAAGVIGGYGVAGGASLAQIAQSSAAAVKRIAKPKGEMTEDQSKIIFDLNKELAEIEETLGVGPKAQQRRLEATQKAEMRMVALDIQEAMKDLDRIDAEKAIKPVVGVEAPPAEAKVTEKPEITPPAEAAKPEIERKPLPKQEVTAKKAQEAIQAIPKELESFAKEARKFETVEQFTEAQREKFIKEQGRDPSSDEVLNSWFKAKQTQKIVGIGFEIAETLPKFDDIPETEKAKFAKTDEGKLILFRGTPKDVRLKTLRFGDFLSPKKAKAQFFGVAKKHEVNAKDIRVLSDDEVVFAPEGKKPDLPQQLSITELFKQAQPPAKVKKMPEIASGGVPTEPPGLTRAEMEHLGAREQRAIRAGQKRGLPIGYKKGYQEAALSGRRALGKLQTDILISKKSKEDVAQTIRRFVPKEEQHRYLTRLSRVKDAKGVAKITGEIEKFIDDYEHRSAVRDFKKFVSSTYKKYNRGEVKLGKLSKSAREQIGKVFGEYDAVSLSEKKAEDLQAHKEHIQRISGSISKAMREWENLDEQGLDVLQLPNRRIIELDRLEKIPVKELSTEDIQYIQDELQSILTNEDRKAQIRERIRSEYAHTYITKAPGEVFDRGKTEKGAVKAPGTVQKFFGTSQANLRTLVRASTAGEAVATEEFLVDRIYESKREADTVHKEWFLYAQEQFDKIGLKESFTKDYYSDISITLGGKKVTVPKHTLLNLWLNTEAEGNLKRLLSAREHQITVKGKTTYISKITLEELQNAIDQMPQEWKRIGEVMFKVNREKNAPAINETALWERGYPIAVYERYFPFPRKLRNVPEGHRTEIQQAMENRGRYQRRTGGILPHVIKDPMVEFLNGLQLDSQYHAMTLALQDAKALLGDNKWRTRMDKTGNKPYVDAIIKMYQRGEGLSSDKSVADILGGKLLTTFGKGTLSARPTGAFIQTASLSAAYSVIDSRHFDSTYIPTPSKANALMEKDATIWWRWKMRQFDYVIGSSAADNAVNKFITGKDKITDALLKHYTWGDQWAVLKIWDAAQNQTVATTEFARGSDEFNEEATTLFHRAMETQPQWDVWHRSLFTSEPGAFERSFALFMSARNAQYNVLYQARDDYNKGRIDKATYGNRVGDIVEANLRVAVLRKLFRKIVGYGTLAVLLGIGKRDEEDVKRYIKKDISKTVEQLPTETVFNMVGLSVYGQIIATVADQALRGFQGKWSRTKFGDVRTGSVITDFLVDLGLAGWGMGKFGRDMALQTRYESGKKLGQLRWKDSGVDVVNDVAEIISQLTGLPYAGPRSDIVWPAKAAAEGTTEDSLYKDKLEELNKKSKKAKQEAIKREVDKGRLPRK